MITAERYHDISMGHRVVGHENKCRHLHGHNYRIHFVCEADQLDALGRVIDFGLINDRLGQWLEEHWDHRLEDLCIVPFNPTAEQIAQHLVHVVGPQCLAGTGIRLTSCRVDETRKCSATCRL